MGNAAFAYLVFGINFDETNPIDVINEHTNMEYEDFEDFIIQNSDKSLTRRQAIEAFPLDIVLHCRSSYPCYILAIKKPQWNPWRGEVNVINPKDLVVDQQTIEFMKSFCEQYGLEWTEPAWLLCPFTED